MEFSSEKDISNESDDKDEQEDKKNLQLTKIKNKAKKLLQKQFIE